MHYRGSNSIAPVAIPNYLLVLFEYLHMGVVSYQCVLFSVKLSSREKSDTLPRMMSGESEE